MQKTKLLGVIAGVVMLAMLAGPLRGDALITTPPGTPADWSALSQPFPLGIDDIYTRDVRKEKAKEEEKIPDGSYVIPREVIVERSIIFNLPPFDGNEAWMSDVGIECPWVHPDNTMGLDYKKLTDFFSFRLRSFLLRFFIAPGEIPSDETSDQFVMMGLPGWMEASFTKFALTDESLINPFGSIPMGWREQKLRAVLEEILERADPESPEATMPTAKNDYERQMFRLLIEELSSGHVYDMDLYFGSKTRSLGREIVPFLIRIVEEVKNKLVRRNAMAYLTTVTNSDMVVYMRRLLEDEDPVVVNRAIMYLARMEDEGSQEWFLSRVQDDTKPWSSFSWYALGRIGKAEAMEVIEKQIVELVKEIDKGNSFLVPAIVKRERIWTLMAALVRCSMKSGQDSVIFLQIANKLRPAQAYQVRTILDMAGLGLAANSYEGKMPQGLMYFYRNHKKVDKFFSALSTSPAPDPTYPFSTRAHYLLFEALQAFPDRFRKAKETYDPITKALQNPYCDTALKYWALRHHDFELTNENRKMMEGFASNRKGNGVVRAAALFGLYKMDREKAVKVSAEILDWFVPRMNQQMLMHAHQTNAVVTAMTILRVEKKLDKLASKVREIAKGKDAKGRPFELGADLASASVVPHIGAFLPAPVIREAVRELGRMRNTNNVKTLAAVISNKESPAKADAAQALGVIGGPEAASVLVKKVGHKDGWVRFHCDRSLERITGEHVECDFIYGSKKEIAMGIQEWKKIVLTWMKTLEE